MSKEDILQELGNGFEFDIHFYSERGKRDLADFILSHAKEVSIGFFKWNAHKVVEYVEWLQKGRHQEEDSQKEYEKQCEIAAFELSSIEKRFELYIESLKNQPHE